MSFNLRIDTNLDDLQGQLVQLRERSIPFAVANAMTTASQAALTRLQERTPRYISRPTPFTLNNVYASPKRVRPSDLSVEFGFKPIAARYLTHLVDGGPRQAKRFEQQLRNTNVIRPGQFAIPTGATPLRLNTYGNLAGSTYVQVLSRLKAFGFGSESSNVSGSRRSQSKRTERDYFAATIGGYRGIYARLGKRPKGNGKGRPITSNLPRGFHTVFYITGAPRYRRLFPVPTILRESFQNAFPDALAQAIRAERVVYAQRARMGKV